MKTDKTYDLRIGYRDFTLKFVERVDRESSLGECRYPPGPLSKGKIKVKKGQQGVEKANTIIHELLHAICYTQGLGLDDKTEERVVTSLANGIIGLIRDNPRFITALIKLARE